MTDAPDTKTESRAVAPIVAFKRDLGRVADAGEFALPSNVSIEAFKNAAIVAAQDNPAILRCTPESVFKSLRRLAAAGLVPDGREAALVPFKGKVDGNWVEVCQAMPMVFGLIKTARNSGEVSDIRAHVVYQREIDEGRFEYVVGDEERLTHTPILFGDRGEAVACYAIAKMKDGSIIRAFLTEHEIEKVRRASAAQRIYEKGKAPVTSDRPIGIWADWTEEMWKKTAIRRLCKRLPLSSEDLRRIQESDEPLESLKDVTPPPSSTDRLRQLRDQGRAAAQPEIIEPEDIPQEPEVAVEEPKPNPKSEAYAEGKQDYQSWGPAGAKCPHDDETEEAFQWWCGWRAAREEAGEAE